MRKRISFWVEDWMWERFFRLLPDHGSRSAFLRNVVARLIEHERLPRPEDILNEEPDDEET